jgi:hypothetical protein
MDQPRYTTPNRFNERQQPSAALFPKAPPRENPKAANNTSRLLRAAPAKAKPKTKAPAKRKR